MRRNYKFMLPVYNIYVRIWESEDRAILVSMFQGPPAQFHPFPYFRRLLCHPFWSGEYENDFDDARRTETPEALFVERPPSIEAT